MNTFSKTNRLTMAAICLALAIVVPQFVHFFPIPGAGNVLLPMHIPVILCGMLAGPWYGLAVGVFSPLISFLVTGGSMPAIVRLPTMVVELAGYGMLAGVLYRQIKTFPPMVRVYVSLVGGMLGGRIFFLAAVFFISLIPGLKALSVATFWETLITGIPGMAVQLTLIPAIMQLLLFGYRKNCRKLLGDKNTFVCRKGRQIRTSDKRGVAPILDLLEGQDDFLEGSQVVDKVIGRAAAFLLIKGGVKVLYTEVISEHALEVLKKHGGMEVHYGRKLPFIENRTKDGMCPMEQATLECSDPEEAYRAVKKKQSELMDKK